MKMTLATTLLTLMFLAQTGLSFADSKAFTLSVIIPPTIQMTDDKMPAAASELSLASANTRPGATIQQQQMVRNGEMVTVKTTVAL